MMRVANTIKRVNDTSFNQSFFLRSSSQPGSPIIRHFGEIGSNAMPPMVHHRKTYQNQFGLNKIVLNQVCLPLHNETSPICHQVETSSDVGIPVRAKRQFVPSNKKDGSYWLKRCKNNDSARRSRFKRKCMDKILEKKLAVLQSENCRLKLHLKMYKQNSEKHSLTSTDQTVSTRNAFDAYSCFQNGDSFPNRSYPEATNMTMLSHSSEDENDSSQSPFTYDYGKYPNLSGSPLYTSDQEVWRSTGSNQFNDGRNISDYNALDSDRNQDDLMSTENPDEKISSLHSIRNVQRVPHKLRLKKNMCSIFDRCYVSDKKVSSED
ncbi:nuclear factor interleukin-3-regulated protein-like [Ylistrum balloti]|uniref:nuclear factor interleukin-3-regulated protein-like n=1 Tax=Ylistrum balloti TaxID=509963 RepID=UPI00290589EB|nr:nuclear factor interleukin-3-regulated protein-like [Ylistrum balloti]